MVVIPLWFGQTFYVLSENVDNVKYSPTDQLLLDRDERHQLIKPLCGCGPGRLAHTRTPLYASCHPDLGA